MSIDERIPGYTDKELATLNDNVRRLSQTGSVKQREEAERLIPLVDAELATRKARTPVRAAKTARKPKAK